MADIDELLKGSFDRLAEPADSAGVADLIRSRVAAGDAGTLVTGTVAPGWKAARPRWFWPLLCTVIGLAGVLAILVAVVLLPSLQPVLTADVETPSPTPTSTPSPTPTPTRTPTPTPTPTPTEEEEEPPPPPPPPRDTVAPSIKAGQWSPNTVYPPNSGCNNTYADILVNATDDVGVTMLSASSSLANTSVTLMSSSASGSVYRFVGTWPPNQQPTQVTVTFTAQDAAGNVASVATALTNGFSCIIIL